MKEIFNRIFNEISSKEDYQKISLSQYHFFLEIFLIINSNEEHLEILEQSK